jgi:serine/threonine-protein kinase RsbT
MKRARKKIAIRSQQDIVEARLVARRLAEELGFLGVDLVIIATVVSEVARSVARGGEVLLSTTRKGGCQGLVIVGRSGRPGAANLALAFQGGCSTSLDYALCLRGAQRSMDNFKIFSDVSQRTTVTMKKWLKSGDGARAAIAGKAADTVRC